MSNLSERRFALDYDCAVAMRYHARRRAFCEQLDRFGTACSFMFGTAGFGAVALKWPITAGIATGLVAVLGALVLAFGVADAWRLHANLFRRWGEVRAGLAALPPDDEAGLRQLEVKKAEIDLEIPPQLSALSVLVENEEKETREDTSLYHVPLLPRLMRTLWTFLGGSQNQFASWNIISR